MRQRICAVPFQNEFIARFPGDETGNKKPRQTPGKLWSKALPTPVREVKLLAWSDELGSALGIEKPTEQKDIDILGGSAVSDTMYPYAACYAGHQFGNWAGQLGDGRAITLGEMQAPDGGIWELQLKGAGPTAYSRRADGRAVLRSSVREYLMSEAMHYLGVPTTRALSLVSTGEPVLRDMFYDGRPANEPGAIVMRVAPTFIRFGNFEILAARGETEELRKLVDWTIDRYFPHITGDDKILTWYKEVVDRTAKLMVEWLRVGFVHGVMNTDNMSILGLTIDYGPYSFVDNYDPSFTPNTTDLPGRRYAFGKQASVAKWNLGCLGGALSPLLGSSDELVKVIDSYDEVFWQAYYSMMSAKLGLDTATKEEASLIQDLEGMLRTIQPDMTLFYQALTDWQADVEDIESVCEHFINSFYKELSREENEQFGRWVTAYAERRKRNGISNSEAYEMMRKANPRFILRNYLLSQAIEELEKGGDSMLHKLQEALKDPYSDNYPEFSGRRPDWANEKAGCSMLSCSS